MEYPKSGGVLQLPPSAVATAAVGRGADSKYYYVRWSGFIRRSFIKKQLLFLNFGFLHFFPLFIQMSSIDPEQQNFFVFSSLLLDEVSGEGLARLFKRQWNQRHDIAANRLGLGQHEPRR